MIKTIVRKPLMIKIINLRLRNNINMIMIYSKNLYVPWCVFMLDLDALCLQLNILSLRFFATMRVKDQVLGNVFVWTFFGIFPTESLTVYTLSGDLAVNFLSDLGSWWGCLRTPWLEIPVRSGDLDEVTYATPWLEIFVPNDKFRFFRLVKVEFSSKFCWASFEGFCLQLSDAKYFSSLIQDIVIKL